MDLLWPPANTAPDHTTILRTEVTWPEVARGLQGIVLGHCLSVLGSAAGAALVVYALVVGNVVDHFELAKPRHILAFIAGLLLLGGSGLGGYILILAGQWRCLMNTPERHGARWLMFACITCIIMGPTLGFVSGMLGGAQQYEVVEKKGTRGLEEIDFDNPVGYLQIASSLLSLLNAVLFLMFLRSVRRCFKNPERVRQVDYFLFFMCFLIGSSLFLTFGSDHPLSQPPILVLLGSGLLLSFVWYLVLVWGTRTCILEGLNNLRSPLEEYSSLSSEEVVF